MTDFVTVISSNALQTTNGYRLFLTISLKAAAATRWLTRTITHATENTREHIRLPIKHIRFSELPLSDQADIAWDVGMSRATPLAIDNFVIVLWI
jgi:hypothetical protein